MWMLPCLFIIAGFLPFQDSTAHGQASADIPSAVTPAQPVITVRGICDKAWPAAAPQQKTCSRSITRAEFEAMMSSLNPDDRPLPPNMRRSLARTYAEYLAVETAVQRAGLGNDPELRQLLDWTRLRAITDFYRRKLQEKYSNPPAAEIEGYYRQHQADYERVKLARILVPRESASVKTREFDEKALQTAKDAQARAVKGDDPAKIQQDAYNTLGLIEPLPVDLGYRKRADMVTEEARDVFSLEPGEVTPVETEAKNYVVYKVINKDVVPLEEVKTEIARAIYQQKFRETMKAALDAVPAELNQEYFGPETDASTPKPPVPPGASR